jgi:dTDP-4-dehydrorhamnose 3,5-epimerase
VAVDLRKSSPTYLKWFGIELTADNHKMLLVPQGFGHGFVTLEDNSEVQYKVDNLYDKPSDRSIKYDDPNIGIKWPVEEFILSEKDKLAPLLKDSDVNFI